MPIELPDDQVIRRRVEKYFQERTELLIHGGIYLAVNAVLWILLFAIFHVPLVWPLLVTLGWGTGLVGHMIEVFSKSPQRIAALDRSVFQQMESIYGPDWREIAEEEDYARINRDTHKRASKHRELRIHLAVFLLANCVIWLFWTIVVGGALWVPVIVLLGWGAGLFGHAVTVYAEAGRSVGARERALEQAVERERARLYGDAPVKEKRKHDRLLLSDDGELLEIVDDEPQLKRKGWPE